MNFSSIWNKLKEIINSMVGTKSVEEALHIAPLISNKMTNAIQLWSYMYEDCSPWLKDATPGDPSMVVSLGLPAYIASEKARMAVLELQSEITSPTETREEDNPDYTPPTMDAFGNVSVSDKPKTIVIEEPTGPTERAEFLNAQYQDKLLSKIRTQLEFGIAKGSLIIKPYVTKSVVKGISGVANSGDEEETVNYNIDFDFIQADGFYPLAFDGNGRLIECAFIQTKTDKESIYSRLEYHKLEGTTVTVVNKAFQNKTYTMNTDRNWSSEADLGKEIGLHSVPEWSALPEKATIQNVDRLLFGYFKMPEANTVDPHSPLGISGFARAEKLIREADKQYSRLLWEYEGGEMAIDVDRDAMNFLDTPEGGKTVMPHGAQRLYRTIDLGESNTYNPFTPTLRDTSYINGLNNILMRIEDVCALSRGTVSEVATEARTATELKILKQRSYSANKEIQKALEKALKDVIYVMDIYCTLYNIVGDCPKTDKGVDTSKMGAYEVSFTWDDSILVDMDTELSKRMTLMNGGVVSKEEIRMWYFGETQRQARQALDRIADENKQAMEDNMLASQMAAQDLGGMPNNGEKPQDNESNPQAGKPKQQQVDGQKQPFEDQKQKAKEVKNDIKNMPAEESK